MAIILNIETSTQVCSVALSVDGKIQSMQESCTKNSHAERITLFSEYVVKESGISFQDLDAVAVSKGPGSYTGLRIGVSTAKGFCFAINKPLISISTLKSMAAGMTQTTENPENFLFCPMIDARRMEVYSAFFNTDLEEIKPTAAVIVDEKFFNDLLVTKKTIFAGDGAAKCKDILSHQENALFINDFNPSASFMAKLSEQKFHNQDFEDVAYFEPYYLKDFIAGIPKVKGLRS